MQKRQRSVKAKLIEELGDGSYKTRNPELERKVIKQLFSRPDQIGIMSATLRADHFADPRYRDIYTKAVDLYVKGKLRRADSSIVLAECLRKPSDEIDPDDYKAAVYEIDHEDKTVDLEQAMTTLNGLMLARRLQAFSHDVISKAGAGEDVNELISEAGSYIKGMSLDAQMADDLKDLDRILEEQKDGASSIIEPERNGILTPFPMLNAVTFGMRRGDITVIGARPGVGKTALIGQISYHAALLANNTILYPLEMGADMMWGRLMCCYCNVTNVDVNSLELTENEKKTCREWLYENEGRKHLRMSEKSGKTPMQIRNDIIRHSDRYGKVDLVVIDYIQRMSAGVSSMMKRYEEVSYISKALKDIATEFDVAILVAASMNREFDKRPGKDKRPELSDLNESGQIESDAGVVIFPYRPSMRAAPGATPEDDELIIKKNRHGATATVPVRYQGAYYRFENLPGRA